MALRTSILAVGAIVVILGAGALAIYLAQATTLVIAVATRDDTEPGLIKAYADALDAGGENVRLKILSFDDVRESAAALQDGRADLAVVRPDVDLPTNGLTLAILRDQTMIIVSPETTEIDDFSQLAGKRLGNLPAGLIAGAAVQTAHVPDKVAGAVLIGVDIGPNLSVTGSLATILWLTAIRREGQDVGFWRFLKLGLLVMPPALLLALAGLLLVP